MSYEIIQKEDPELYASLIREDQRQENSLELIASENFVSRNVLQAYTSTLTNKYAEGYPSKRYYGGCEFADEIENLAIRRAKSIFSVDYANVQPHSGTQANMAVFSTALNPGDKILGMDLSHGGHLTHGSKVSFSGRYYDFVSYGVRKEDHRIDYEQLEKTAKEHRPKMIIAGASAYPRIIDFAHFATIAQEVGAFLLADIAHISGLVACGLHPSPIDHADFITTTTHKTLRGPRGGLILTNKKEYEKKINFHLFPGVQGGPLMHVIAAKAAAFGEALRSDFKEYQKQVIQNAKKLAKTFASRGVEVISQGTDNHQVLLNVYESRNITGKDAQDLLEEVGLTTNKNTVPFDQNPPVITSGIRLGTPALSTRGLKETEFEKIAHLITNVLEAPQDSTVKARTKQEVHDICEAFPMEHFCL